MKKYLTLLIFVLILVFLGLAAAGRFLYLDDVVLIFPAVTKTYLSHFQNYIRDNGFFRPGALFYYYFIYTLYLHFPVLAHFFPILIFVGSGYLLYHILLKQGQSEKVSLALALLFLAIPFWAEAYAWFSANIGILSAFLFLLSVFLLESFRPSRKTLMVLFFIQLFSAFLYENTFFIPLALALLWVKKQGFGSLLDKGRSFVLTAIFLFLPRVFYLIGNLILKPQVETRMKFLDFSEIINNCGRAFLAIKRLFSLYFIDSAFQGIKALVEYPILFPLLLLVVLVIVWKLFFPPPPRSEPKEKSFYFGFWLLCFILSLIPLCWQKYYWPFRTLSLPIVLILISLSFLWTENHFPLSAKILAKFVLIMTVIFGLLGQVGMIKGYRQQFADDQKMITEIAEKTVALGFTPERRTNILLTDFPNNTVDSFIYGDYLFSIFHYSWSAEAWADLNSGTTKSFSISFQQDFPLSSRYTEEQILNLKPLTVFAFTGNCRSDDCFKEIRGE